MMSQSQSTLPSELTVFPLLSDPAGYQRCQFNLAEVEHLRRYWLGLFRDHFPKLLAEALRVAEHHGEDMVDAQARMEQCRVEFYDFLDSLAGDDPAEPNFDTYSICVKREAILRAADIADPYLLAKRRENEAAIALLPGLLERVDALPVEERLPVLLRGVFAGNIFDLGAVKTADLFKDNSVDFDAVLAQLKDRPWLVDDYDPLVDRLLNGPRHRAAVLFVDNAGCDVLLGMLPFGRFLLQQGVGVILTANPEPSLNDITHDELVELVDRIAQWDPVIREALASGQLELVHSGNTVPLIDLKQVSTEIAEAVQRRGVDLVVLEGMGRGIESNLKAEFVCDAVNIAMIKDKGVADELGGEVYDLLLRFKPASG